MRRQVLVSTATAAILSGLVFAAAQEMPRGGGKQEGTIQNQGSPGGAERGRGESQPRQGMPQRQNEGQGTQGQRSQREPNRGEPGRSKANQAQPKPDRSQQQTTGQGQREQGKAKQQAQPKPDSDRGRQQTSGQGQRERGKAKQQARPGSEPGSDRTVGQGRQQDRQPGRQDAGDRTSVQGRGQLSVEQRTRIRQTVFARSDVPRVNNVNFRISVGTVAPARVRTVAVRLPAEIVEIRPQFRDHYYVVVRDEIIILDNRHRIVEVIPVDAAGGSGPAVRGSTQVIVDLSPDEIREVQLVLIERGFSIEADGILGPRTRQALTQFQRREGLQVTGQIDRRTIASLGVSVRSGQGGGGQQPSTTGQGGRNQGSGSAQQPSRSDQDPRQPQRSPMNQHGSGAGSKSGQKPDSPTAGQGSGTTGQGQGSGADQSPPANQGSGAGQGGAGNSPAKQAPQGGANGGAGSMPRGQSK